jgi:thymidylate synthase
MLQFDLQQGFPAITTKKLAFNAVKGELIGFIRGYDNAAAFRKLGCNVWDQNANENTAWLSNPNRRCTDDLGRIYGRQWRSWENGVQSPIDQLKQAVNAVQNDPTSRRIIVNAWNPGELNVMALPPCHMMFQLQPDQESNTLSMCMYQRSCDMFLGVPFNIASYALLLEIIAAATGYKAGELTMFMADVHIYKNHIQQVEAQLSRTHFKLPQLNISQQFFDRSVTAITRIDKCEPSDFTLVGYKSHEAIKAEMAV